MLTFSADSPATFTCALDGAVFTPFTSPTTDTGLAEGAQRSAVRATDGTGNTDPTPAVHTSTIRPPVDTTPPDTRIDAGPADPTTDTGALFACSAGEPCRGHRHGGGRRGRMGQREGPGRELRHRRDRCAKNREAARGLVRFDLPAAPAGCTVVRAELVLHNSSGRTGAASRCSRPAPPGPRPP